MKAWYKYTIEECYTALKSSHNGLSSKEADARLKQHGLNSIEKEKNTNALVLFFHQFTNILSVILIIAVAISWFLGDILDAIVIAIAVCLNVIVGFIQEWKSQNSLSQLRKALIYRVKVLRDNEIQEIDSSRCVPGDILVLVAGDRVPADARVISVNGECEVNESLLTGESSAVKKHSAVIKKDVLLADRKNMFFAGTLVVQGSARAVVIATGPYTEIGIIARSIKNIKETATPLQKGLNRFGTWIGGVIIAIACIVFITGFAFGIPLEEIFSLSVALAVAAIPEGLLIAVTVILAIGMQRILKEGSIVRKLVATETLGSTTVICTDKTGTLTEGAMRVAHIVSASHQFDVGRHKQKELESIGAAQELEEMMKVAVLNNNAFIENPEDQFEHVRIKGSATESALLHAALTIGIDIKAVKKEFPRIDELPFDSKNTYMLTLHRDGEISRVYAKGAPEKIVASCNRLLVGKRKIILSVKRRKEFERDIERMSSMGLRIVACAFRDSNREIRLLKKENIELSDMTLIGFFAMKDPLREDARQTLQESSLAGVRTIMMTGDHRLTAKAIGEELGMKVGSDQMIDGTQLDVMSTDELARAVKTVSIFARVTPDHKLNIVSALQSNGEVVAMTGDGVNDAPALKQADIGVALGSGTDVAKGVADIVILDNRFSTIVKTVKEGRIIFDNIRSVVLYLLTDSFSEVILIFLALLARVELPLIAVQILWINLVTDGFSDIALTLEPGDPDVMLDAPRKKDEPLVNREMKVLIGIVSSVSAVVAFATFLFVKAKTGDTDLARTVVFAMLGLDSLFYVFSLRSLRKPLWKLKFFTNGYLIASVIIAFFVQMAGIYVPVLQRVLQTTALDISHWLIVLIECVAIVVITEGVKGVFLKKERQKRTVPTSATVVVLAKG